MAEIFKNPDLILTPSVNSPSAGGKEHTGNNEIDAYINSLPEDEREEALLAITAPKTGEDVHNEMLAADQAGEILDPSKEDWLKLNQFYRTRETDYLHLLSEGAGEIYKTFGKAMTSVADDPSMENFAKVTPSVIEGALQNLRGLYGIAAESVDSTSAQAKFFNILNGRTQDSDESYRVFLEARHFNRESQQYAEGKKTILVDKNHLNNDFVQAAALVADPTMFIPFGKAFSVAGGMLGMSERAMALSARTANLKNKILGGALKYGAGMPIEFIGKGTRVTLDHAIATGEKAFVAATGVSSETFREGMRMSGVGSLGAGYFGHSVPLLTDASGAYVAGTAAAGVGEAVSVIGHQIMKGERGIASYAKQAMLDSAKQGVELSAHSKSLLKIIDGFDPLIDYTTTIAQGAAHGAMIGGGLGYWSGNEEGLAKGIGAGIALGSIGGTGGKFLADVTGRTTRHRTHIQAKLVIEGLRDIHPEQAEKWERAQAWASTRGFSLDGIIASKDTVHPNTHIEVLTNREYANYLRENGLNPDTYDGKTFLKDGDQPLSLRSFEQQNGYVVENRANGTVKIYLNADAAPRATVGHELFHSILRNSVMKDYYAQAVKEKVIGSRDAQGNLSNRGIIDIREVKEMFRRYLDAEFKDPAERADAQSRLEMAENAFETNGQLVSDPSLGGRPLLEHLSEEFGAYYFSHLVMDKPIDWLYHGGDLPGIRGVLDNAGMLYRNYWRSRMNLSAPQFDFNRTFIDENGVEKLVPIDEVFAPASRDMFGNITGKTERVVNPAMDLFFRDMLRIEKKVNETGQFDIAKLDKQTQQRYIDSEGLDGVFTKDQFGNYQHSTEAQIKRENKVKGKAVYQLLMGIPEAERTFVIDADGNIRGHLTPQMLDNIVNAGHMTRAMANKISLFQSIARGEAAGNIVDFGGIGATAERPMDVNNPRRMYGGRVPYKSRTAIVFGLDTVIGKDGKFQFKGNMLDYKVIETRANNEWSNSDVQRLWNGNHTEYLADFFRYLENASKNHDDPTRVPSAELWTDGKGGERRNVLHQVLGMAKGEADTFLNTPKAEINRNAYSTVMSFSLNRMTNLRLRNQSVPFKFDNAYRDLVRNWSPSEMDSELTPRGTVFKHPSGFKFVQRQDGKTDAFDEQGKRIGTYQTAKEAAEAGRRYAAKHPSTVLLKDNMTDNSVINRSPNEGAGELGTSRYGVPREEPRFRDSIGYYEQFAIDRNRELPFDPTYFESLVTKNRGKKGVEGSLNFDNAPNPKYHNLWQYLDYHQQAKSTVTVGDVLNFIKEQGIHTSPNMPVDIHSKYAQMLLALSDTNQLNTRVELLNSGSWTGGETIVTMTRQYQQILMREATLRERYNMLTSQYQKAPTVELKKELENLKKHLEGNKKEKEKQKQDIKKATEERRLGDEDESEDGDTEKKDKYRFPIRMVRERKSHQQMFLNLAELIDRTWAADQYKHTLGNYSGSERIRRQQALQGMSFEGTALEELAHSIFGRISREAGEAAPELAALINTDAPTSISGDAWKHNVNKFLGKTKQQIKDGIILPPSVVSFARILELQKYAAENTFVMNPKGVIETLWDSKGYKLNDNVYTDKGKLKSNRGALKKGYRIINPWEFDNTGKNRFKGDQEYSVPNSWKELSVYRLGSTQEFMIALLNDPTHLARWNHMPVKPNLLDALNTPDVDVGFQKNVANLHNQMSDALSQFIGYEGTFSHQILEEMIRTINAGREGAGSNAPMDIQRVDVGNKRGRKRSELPERPKGFLTPYEKAFVNDWRVNMERWAEANGKPNALEGLSDFEIWERVGEDKPPFEGSDEAMKDPALWKVNAKDIAESRSQGVENQWLKDNEKKYARKTKEVEEARKNLRVARWDDDLQKWVMIDDTEATGVDTTTDPIVDPVDKDKDTTVDPDRDKDTTVDPDRDKDTTVDPDKDKDTTTDPDRDKDTTVDPDRDKDGGGRDRDRDGRGGRDRDGKPPVPPAPIPKRTFTDADIRVWRSWKTETYGNGSALKNALGYIIMSLNKNFRVYNPEKVLIGIYKNEEEAKRRVQREEPKR